MKFRKQGFLIFIILFLTVIPFLSGQEEAKEKKDFPKRRDYYYPRFDVDDIPFSLVAIKTEYDEEEEIFFINLRFNRIIFAPSVKPQSIVINDRVLPMGAIRFSKSGRGIEIAYKGNREVNSLRVEGIMSNFGEILIPEEIEDLEQDTVYFLKREKPEIPREQKDQESEE